MPNANVDVNKLAVARTTMEQCNVSMQSVLNNLSNTVAEVGRTAYVSDASKELTAVSEAMKTRFAELKRDVEAFTRYLEERKSTYTVVESDAGKNIGSMKHAFD